MNLEQNLLRIKSNLEIACDKARRDPKSVRLMMVSKTIPVEVVAEAISCSCAIFGYALLGENRVQEGLPKSLAIKSLPAKSLKGQLLEEQSLSQPEWHLIGHLQSNKAKQALQFAANIHSVDRESLVLELEKNIPSGTRYPVLLQVNTSFEDSKSGVHPDGALELAKRIASSNSLELRGLMTIATLSGDADETARCFRLLSQLRKEMRDAGCGELPEMSMGMSSDYEAAIAAGSTIVRVGSAIFGTR